MAIQDTIVASAVRSFTSGFSTDLKSRNWSIYGQWLGFLCFPVCVALGIVNMLHLSLVIIFSIICLVQSLLVVFLEIPFFLKICPVTERFTAFLRVFHQNLPRAGFYFLMAVIQYVSIAVQATSLIAVAILFTMTSISYLLAYLSKQAFTESATLGGDNEPREMLP